MHGSYEKAINGMENYWHKKHFLKELQITSSISKKNINQLDQMHEVFSKLPINSWRVMNADPIGRAEDNKDLLLDDKEYQRLIGSYC